MLKLPRSSILNRSNWMSVASIALVIAMSAMFMRMSFSQLLLRNSNNIDKNTALFDGIIPSSWIRWDVPQRYF